MINNNHYIINDYTQKLYDIAENINKLNENEYKKGFWEIINLYNLDTIGICNADNGYKTEYQIEQLFALLNGDNNFCIKIHKKLLCSLCNNIEEKDEVLPCLVNINKSDLNMKSISEKIISLKLTTSSACINCSYDNEGKIKNNTIYEKCKTHLTTDIALLNILIFTLELSDEKDLDIIQYRNLKDLREKYKHLISFEFTVYNLNYKLIGMINMPS